MKRTFIFITLFIFFFGLIIFGINSYLAPRDKLRKADVIVAVSGGDTQARAQTAIWLYQEGWSETIIFSGAAADPDSPSNAEIMKRFAIANGVPEQDVITEEFSFDTAQNAAQSKKIIDDNSYKSVILVTSQYHQRRVFREFESRLGESTEFINYPARDERWDDRLWWTSPYGVYLVSSELAKNLFLTFSL